MGVGMGTSCSSHVHTWQGAGFPSLVILRGWGWGPGCWGWETGPDLVPASPLAREDPTGRPSACAGPRAQWERERGGAPVRSGQDARSSRGHRQIPPRQTHFLPPSPSAPTLISRTVKYTTHYVLPSTHLRIPFFLLCLPFLGPSRSFFFRHPALLCNNGNRCAKPTISSLNPCRRGGSDWGQWVGAGGWGAAQRTHCSWRGGSHSSPGDRRRSPRPLQRCVISMVLHARASGAPTAGRASGGNRPAATAVSRLQVCARVIPFAVGCVSLQARRTGAKISQHGDGDGAGHGSGMRGCEGPN